MSLNDLVNFKNAVDEEITAYESMEELYRLKQAILVQGKSDALWDVDAKILNNYEHIKSINSKRKQAAKYIGGEDITMSEVIEKAKNANIGLSKQLEEQKTKLNVLSSSISLYEKTNMDLIKHGLVMAGKTLDIIMNVISPKANEYNNFGKNIGNDKMQISSVIEEA